MASPTRELVDALWDSLVASRSLTTQRSALSRRVAGESLPPPSLMELRKSMRSYLAEAFTRDPAARNLLSKAEVEVFLAQVSPITLERLENLVRTIQWLDGVNVEDFRWNTREEGFPRIGQSVIYYFEMVGAHPGRYAGQDTSEEGGGMDLFGGDFGGFLGGDVTHWIARP